MSVRRDAVYDDAIAHVNDAVEIHRGLGIVRDHHDRLAQILVQAPEHFQHDFGILGVEIARGFVGKQNLWLIDDGARDGDALLLSAGHLRRPVVKTPFEPEHLGDNVKAVRIEAVAVDVLRDGDVALGGTAPGSRLKRWNTKPILWRRSFGTLRIGHRRKVVAIHVHLAARSLRQTADYI